MGRPLEEILAELAQVRANNNQKIMAAGLGAPKQFSDDIIPAENYYTSGAPTHKVTYDYDPAIETLKATVQKIETPKYEAPQYEPTQEEPAKTGQTIAEYFNTQPSKWDELESRPDYEENSQFRSTYRSEPVKPLFTQFEGNVDNGYDDIEHDIINGDKNAKLTWLADNGWNNVETNRMATLEGLNDKQKKNYNYLYNTEGKESAKAYLDDIQKDLNAQRMATDKAYWQEEGKKNPGIVSIAASGILGLNSAVENLAIPSNMGNLKGNPSVFQATNASRAIQQGAQANASGLDKALWQFGNAAGGIVAQAFGGNAAKYFMAASTFNSTLYDELEKGVGEAPALGIAAVTAGTELAARQYIGKQIGLKGLSGQTLIGEFATETGIPKMVAAFVPGYIGNAGKKLANVVADTMLASDKSHAAQLYSKHVESGESPWQAAGNTMKDLTDEIISEGAVGGIATGLMTGLNDLVESLRKPETGLSVPEKLNEYEKPLEIGQNDDVSMPDMASDNLPVPYGPEDAPVAPEPNVPIVPDTLPAEDVELPTEANTSEIEPNDIVPDPVYNMDEGKMQVYQAVKGLEELGNAGSYTMISFYNGEDPGAYMSEMMRYYTAGVGGQDLTNLPESGLLNEAQIKAAYESGVSDWQNQSEVAEPVETPVEEPIEAPSTKATEGNYQVGDKIFTTEDEAVNYVLGGKAEPGSKIVRTNEPANSSYDRKGGLKTVENAEPRPYAEPQETNWRVGNYVFGTKAEATSLANRTGGLLSPTETTDPVTHVEEIPGVITPIEDVGKDFTPTPVVTRKEENENERQGNTGEIPEVHEGSDNSGNADISGEPSPKTLDTDETGNDRGNVSEQATDSDDTKKGSGAGGSNGENVGERSEPSRSGRSDVGGNQDKPSVETPLYNLPAEEMAHSTSPLAFPLDDISEEDMVKQISEATGLSFKYNKDTEEYVYTYGPKNKRVEVTLKYRNYSPTTNGGKRHISASISRKYGNFAGASEPFDSIDDAISFINANKDRFIQKESKKKEDSPVVEQTEVKEDIASQTSEKAVSKGSDFKITEKNYSQVPTTDHERSKANVEAIKTIKTLIAEDRTATSKEKDILAAYTGWGGLQDSFRYGTIYDELRNNLTDEEFESARQSVLSAYYTEPNIIESIFKGLKQMGYNGGRMLEPSVGVGRFLGAMPSDMKQGTVSRVGVELDTITGNIAKYLYPNADIRIEGFEKAIIPQNFFDIVVGNVPFGTNTPVFDKTYPNYITRDIHNYFIAKSIDSVRPGGLVCVITATGMLDNATSYKARENFSSKADFVGAIRLPNNAFKSSGAKNILSDIVIFKKRKEKTAYTGEDFISIAEKDYPSPFNYDRTAPVSINEYFYAHPEMILGEPVAANGRYGVVLDVRPEGDDLDKQIVKAFKHIKVKMDYDIEPTPEVIEETRKSNDKKKKNVVKTKSGVSINGVEVSSSDKKQAKEADILSKYCDIRDTARDLIRMQEDGEPEEDTIAKRKELNKLYDEFVKKYGPLHKQTNKKLFGIDSDVPFVLSLENYDKDSKTATKNAIFSKDVVTPKTVITHANSAEEALIVSMNTTGRVDIPKIASLCDTTIEKAADELISNNLIFKTGDNTYEIAANYLSGNVRAKLKNAQALAETDKSYERNVKALEEVCPKELETDEIDVAIGATWLPDEYYSMFASEMLGATNKVYTYDTRDYEWPITVRYNAPAGSYVVKVYDPSLTRRAENYSVWGTDDKPFVSWDERSHGLLDCILNELSTKVEKTDEDKKRYVDQKASALAAVKAEEIKDRFKEWLSEDKDRSANVKELYNTILNNTVVPVYDGSTLEIDGLSSEYELRPHQKVAVQRVVLGGGNTLLAHRVGAGKTLEMICASMKLKQLGIIKKPVFVVPKSTLAQWEDSFIKAFPSARVLKIDEKGLDKDNKEEGIAKLVTDDYDAIIMHYENFIKIPMSREYVENFKRTQINAVMQAIDEARGDKMTVRQLEKARKRIEKVFEELLAKYDKNLGVFDFEKLGIDALFVDEAQNFKNLYYFTGMDDVTDMGNQEGSGRAMDLYMKTRYLQSVNGGRGLVFATATPIMNSVAEAYTMQRYLQEPLLEEKGMSNFDAWAKNFARSKTILRPKSSGTGYELKQSLSSYKNLPEFMQMWGLMADVVIDPKDLPWLDIPTIAGGKRTVIECDPTQFQLDYMKQLAIRGEQVKGRRAQKGEDNMLKIMDEARKLAYTQRFIDPSLDYEPNGKVINLVKNVSRIYKETSKDKGTQLIFIDRGVPGGAQAEAGVNLYEDVKNFLVADGIPADEIVFFHDAKTDSAKLKLFDDVNEGKVRVVIGSSGKMGVGVNMQHRAAAIHEFNPVMRPGDVEQNEGRVLRQGNIFKEVEVLVYVTKNSFDTVEWARIYRKQGFINQIMTGTFKGRDLDDEGDLAVSAAQISAVASGNPLILKQFELSEKVRLLEIEQSEHGKKVANAKRSITELNTNIGIYKSNLEKLNKDLKTVKDIDGDKFQITLEGTTYKADKRPEASKKLLELATDIFSLTKATDDRTKIGSFAGFDLYASTKGNLVLKGALEYSIKTNFQSAPGTMTMLCNKVEKDISQARADALETSISEAERNIKKYEEISKSSFDKTEELAQARAEEESVRVQLENSGDDVRLVSPMIDQMTDPNPKKEWWHTERTGEKEKKPLSIRDLVHKIEHDFGVNITEGHVRGGKVRGFYNRGNKGIRIKYSEDLPTALHELGHKLADEYGLNDMKLSKDAKEEIKNVVSEIGDNYSKKEQQSEGIAEFWRNFFRNRVETEEKYPHLYKEILQKITPADLVEIYNLADETNAAFALKPSPIRLKEEADKDYRTLKEKGSDWYLRKRIDWIDKDEPIKRISREAYILAKNSVYANGTTDTIINRALVDKEGKYLFKSLKDVLKNIDTTNAEEYRDFNMYVTCIHGIERVHNGKQVFADAEMNRPGWMRREATRLQNKYPEFKQAAMDLFEFEKTFMEHWAVGNLISAETFENWNTLYEHHVPLFRVADNTGALGGKRYANLNSPFRAAYGSGKMIVAPVDNIIDEVMKTVSLVRRNDVMLALRNEIERMVADGEENSAIFMEKIPAPKVGHRVSTSGLKSEMKAELEAAKTNKIIDEEALETLDDVVDSLDDILVQYSLGKPYGDIVTVLVNGMPEFWLVNDKYLLESLVNMSAPNMHGFVEALGKTTRFLSANMTSNNPLFNFSNGVRDFLTSLVQSPTTHNPLRQLKDIGEAYWINVKAAKDKGHVDELHLEYLGLGGGHDSPLGVGRNAAKETRMRLSGSEKEKILYWINPLNIITTVADAVENAPREAEYRRSRREGYSQQDAFRNSREVTVDFGTSGIKTRNVGRAVPFFGASIQGPDRFLRWLTADDVGGGAPPRKPPVTGDKNFSRDPEYRRKLRAKVATQRFAVFTAVSAIIAFLVYALNNKDEKSKKEYQRLSNYTKNVYWPIPLGDGTFLALPKPRELAIISSLFERIMELTEGGNTRSFNEFYDYVAENLFPSILSDIAKLPSDIYKDGLNGGFAGMFADILGEFGLIGVGANLVANRDFLGRPIIGTYLQDEMPKNQYDEKTSILAHLLGQIFNLSPQGIDYLGSQTLGYLWKAQKALFPVGEENIDYTLGAKNTYVKDSLYSQDYVNELYDLKEKSAAEAKDDNASMDTKILAQMDKNMASFYSNFNKLNKQWDSEDPRGYRAIVLDMIKEYLLTRDEAPTKALQTIEDVVKESGDTSLLPAIMKTKITNSKKDEFELRDSEYYEYQTLYNGLYYSKVEASITSDMSIEKKTAVIKQAREEAEKDAANIMLKRHFTGSIKGATANTENEADYISPASTISTAEKKASDAEHKALVEDSKNNIESNPTRVEVSNSNLWGRASQEQKDYFDNILVKLATGTDSTSENYRKQVSRARQYGYSETDWARFQLARQITDKPNSDGKYHTYTADENKAAAEMAGLSYEKIKRILSNKTK